jgi:hypothetical protein
MSTLQKAIVTATVAILAGAGIYEARQTAKLRGQNQALRQQQAPLTEEIRGLERERDDARSRLVSLTDEMERIKGNSSELLKLRGEVNRLRTEAETAAAEVKELKQDQSLMRRFISNTPPIKTFVSTTMTTAAWNQGIVTGGWKTPSGKRALVLTTPGRGGEAQQLAIKSYVLEYTEEAGKALGLAQFNTDEQTSNKTHKFEADEFETLMKAVQNHEGVELVAAPSVVTASGRLVEVQACDVHGWADQQYSTGPVLNFVPTISPDGQSVQMVIAARLNCWSQPPP